MNIIYLIAPFLIPPVISILNRKLGYLSIILASLYLLIFSLYKYPYELNTLFITISTIVWILTSIFSIKYDDYGNWLSPLYGITILGIVIILESSNYIEFLSGWEIMTIPAYVAIGLIKKEFRPAYIFMAFGELSTALLLASFIIASADTNTILFTQLISPLPLILATLGFLTKMGITPFMVSEWLPIAHGTAPSNLSSVLSSTMTLMGIYGILKMSDLTQNIPIAFSLLVSIIGAFSVFFGSLYAYVNENTKGILAFSTIENNGAMLVSIGLFMFAKQLGITSTENIAFYTIIIYSFAHSIAKGGLFMSTGVEEAQAISFSKKVRDKYYVLGLILLTSSMSGLLPNLGGIAAWLTLENLFIISYILHSLISIIFIVIGSIMAMGDGFATALLVRYITYLSLFRVDRKKIDKLLVIPVLISGTLILVFGNILPYLLYPYKTSLPQLGILGNLLIVTEYSNNIFGVISPLYITLLISMFSLVTYLVFGKPKIRRVKIWNNGVNDQEEYTAFAMSNNIRLMLRKILKPEESGYLPSYGIDIFWEYIYKFSRGARNFGEKFGRALINSSISWYIVYIIIVLIIISLIITI
jgi:formate hydrogenlyase subunit 3/multisubunit Na+/H+ antiporter MnhD subunit